MTDGSRLRCPVHASQSRVDSATAVGDAPAARATFRRADLMRRASRAAGRDMSAHGDQRPLGLSRLPPWSLELRQGRLNRCGFLAGGERQPGGFGSLTIRLASTLELTSSTDAGISGIGYEASGVSRLGRREEHHIGATAQFLERHL
jgi:hypothetical protein